MRQQGSPLLLPFAFFSVAMDSQLKEAIEKDVKKALGSVKEGVRKNFRSLAPRSNPSYRKNMCLRVMLVAAVTCYLVRIEIFFFADQMIFYQFSEKTSEEPLI